MSELAERRTLIFTGLNDVMPEVDRLLLGYRTLGAWSLGQVCNHLSAAIIGSVEGFPFGPPPILRKTVGPMLFRRMLRNGKFPQGVKIPAEFEPGPGLDDRAEAEALRASINYFRAHGGPWAEHPVGGPITRESWDQFHALHAAHHLSLILPE